MSARIHRTDSRRFGSTRRWLVCLTAAVALGATACAAAPEPPPPTDVPAADYEAGAGIVTFADLGWDNGPAASVPVPADVVVIQQVDQANVITASFSHPDGPAIAEVLRTELPRAGWTVTTDANDSLLFERDGWSGAFTVSPQEVSALTVRAATPQ